MRLSFYGAAGEVTGSCYLLETSRARVLIDFGLHQGGSDADKRNRVLPPLGIDRLTCVLLTHAHLDHTGRLPLLARAGYKRPIYCTSATAELTELILNDSAYLQESDADHETRRLARQGKPGVTPLYTKEDVPPILQLMQSVPYDTPREVAPGISVRWVDAGHILGSASLEVTVTEAADTRVIAFSGDIGEKGSPLLKDPIPVPRADVLLLESTYGDRDHRGRPASVDELGQILIDASHSHGKVLIPAFAVGRTQQLIYHMSELARDNKLNQSSVYIDSPMAIETTTLYRRHRECMDDETWARLQSGDTPLSFPRLHYTRTSQESKSLNELDGGVIIISASGMCTGGRILHHLRHNLWRPEAHVLFVGYQAEGTLGRRLVDGAKLVNIMGEPIAVKAQIHTVNGFSAHAGQSGLLEWAAHCKSPSGATPRTFLTHGEPQARTVLGQKLTESLGTRPEFPLWGQSFDL